MTTSTLTTTPRNFNCPVTEVGCTDSRCIQSFCARERDEREEAEESRASHGGKDGEALWPILGSTKRFIDRTKSP